MAIIHRTTLNPTKLELLTAWLPSRPWYLGTDGAPVLSRNGGFRLDDPRGEVGIEFLVATDVSGGRPVAYHVPLSYRGAPLEGAEEALIGTSEHGVLGRRWVYDGAHDPVLVAELLALLQKRAEPQAQSLSDTPDPTVVVHFDGTGTEAVAGAAPAAVAEGPDGTRVTLEGDRRPALRVTRVLRPADGPPADASGHVTAGWRSPDGDGLRAVFASLVTTGP